MSAVKTPTWSCGNTALYAGVTSLFLHVRSGLTDPSMTWPEVAGLRTSGSLCFNLTKCLVGPERFLQMKASGARSWSLAAPGVNHCQSCKPRPHSVKWWGSARAAVLNFHVRLENWYFQSSCF